MNLKLFLSTFVLIFLAELGDKTQLAAMARAAAGDGGKLTIFLAASSALVLSTLIAVLLGALVNKIIPPMAIKIAAGLVFILFGILMFISAFRAPVAKPEPAVVAKPAPWALALALDFEKAAVAQYRRMAAACTDEASAAILCALAGEEERHVQHLQAALAHHGDLALAAEHTDHISDLGAMKPAQGQELDRNLLDRVIEHEEHMAGFYRQVARSTGIPALRDTMQLLADEEQRHVRELRTL